jgi:hypothetical protein
VKAPLEAVSFWRGFLLSTHHGSLFVVCSALHGGVKSG